MRVLTTPDERFQDLPGFGFEPRYIEVPAGDGDALRVHYVDEGPPDGAVVLMLHGEPSWSYLYRKMIPPIAAAGLRAIAPDLVGFGRSDKPADPNDYSFLAHVDWMKAVIDGLGLKDINLVCQDWGGLIGLRLVGEWPDRFARVVAANTFLPTGDMDLGEAFHRWREYATTVPEFPIGDAVERGCVSSFSPEVKAAYDAPFPDESYKQGARRFPALVPASPDDPAAPANRAAWEVLSKWDKPFLTAFGDSDPITRGGDRVMQAVIPGAADSPHTTVADAGHFIQEDKGEELARIVIDFISST